MYVYIYFIYSSIDTHMYMCVLYMYLYMCVLYMYLYMYVAASTCTYTKSRIEVPARA